MRLAERQALAAEKAKSLMVPADYAIITEAIFLHKPVLFKYTDRFQKYSQYRAEYVEGFVWFPQTVIWPGTVCAWSWHELHRKKEQYRVERIQDVKIIITLIEALLDPSRHFVYWDGSTSSLETTPL